MYELSAKNRQTKKWETLEEFEDSRQFDFMLDKVDPSIYYEAMIIERTYPMPTLMRYWEYRSYEPAIKNPGKLKKINFPRNPQKRG